MVSKVCSRKRQKIDQLNCFAYKPRDGEIVEEDDGVYVTIHGDDGRHIHIYDTDVKRKAAEPTCIAPPVEKIKSSQKMKVNNTTVSYVGRMLAAATNVQLAAAKCCNERI